MIVKHDGKYWMFAEGRHDRAHLLVSEDGLDWKPLGKLDIRLKNGDPISRRPLRHARPPGSKTAAGISSTSATTTASGWPRPTT